MAEVTETNGRDVQEAAPATGRRPRAIEEEEEEDMETPDMNSVAMKIERAKEAYKEYVGGGGGGGGRWCDEQEKPTKGEVFGWYFYGMCSYFVLSVLVPILFPLIISQTVSKPKQPQRGWFRSYMDLQCEQREVQLYETLIQRAIKINNSIKLSPLEWTSVSWVLGLFLAAPVVGMMSIHLDHGQNQQQQQVIAGAITAIGALFCLPAGFFNTRWIFPPYIAAIIIANTIGNAFHCRHLGLMIRGFVVGSDRKFRFRERIALGGLLSLYATAAGCLGSATISAFIYYMLRKSDSFTSLWVVSIFSGLIWLTGTSQIFTTQRNVVTIVAPPPPTSKTHHVMVSIFKYPHAAGSLAGVFLSSLTTMCIFTAGVLYAVGDLCIKEVNILFLWLLHFMFPLVSLPLLQQLQKMIRADALKMQLLGFLLTSITSGFAFYFRNHKWNVGHLLFFAAIHSSGTGLLYAFGRVLLLDCSPVGKEGVFSAWFSWIRCVGTCIGFAVASALPRNVETSFGIAFCCGLIGMVVLIFGNIDHFRGAKAAAGHVVDHHHNNTTHGDDFPSEEKMEV